MSLRTTRGSHWIEKEWQCLSAYMAATPSSSPSPIKFLIYTDIPVYTVLLPFWYIPSCYDSWSLSTNTCAETYMPYNIECYVGYILWCSDFQCHIYNMALCPKSGAFQFHIKDLLEVCSATWTCNRLQKRPGGSSPVMSCGRRRQPQHASLDHDQTYMPCLYSK